MATTAIRYFIGPYPYDAPTALALNSIIYGNIVNQRPSLDNTQIVVMLPEGDTGTYPALSAFTEYTFEEVKPIMDGPFWTEDIFNVAE